MDQVTITLDADLIREALLALADRRVSLRDQLRANPSPRVQAIVEDQALRVRDAMQALGEAVGETWV